MEGIRARLVSPSVGADVRKGRERSGDDDRRYTSSPAIAASAGRLRALGLAELLPDLATLAPPSEEPRSRGDLFAPRGAPLLPAAEPLPQTRPRRPVTLGGALRSPRGSRGAAHLVADLLASRPRRFRRPVPRH